MKIMVSCLLCLEIVKAGLDSISINSTQWQEFDLARKIEKHFWSLIKVHSKSVICTPCWKEVNKFHKFYLRIEKAHLKFNKIKTEPEVITLECKNVLITELSNKEYNDAESDNNNVECFFLEPEILIDQSQSLDLVEETSDEKCGIMEPLDIIPLTLGRQQFQSCNDKVDNDPLEKTENFSCQTFRKRKHSKSETLGENTNAEIKFSKIPTLNSDTASEKYDSEIKSPEIDKGKTSMSSVKSRINRDECDKFIEEHFKQMNCNICQIPLENFSATQKHFLGIHQQKGYLFCCNRKFFKRRDLVDHIHCHLNPNHFKCAKCDKILSDRVRLEKHEMGVHGGVKVKKHSCDTCGKSFLEIHDLNMHKLTHLSEDEKKFPCKECGKFYGSSYLLHRHTQAVHLKKFVKICYICGKSLSSSTELKIHLNKHEGTPQPVINCDICGLRLTTERGLKRHKDSQHPIDGKKDHHCPICPKISPTLKALRKHINTMHEKGYDHKCSICQKAFKRAEVLREHMASHTGTPLYTCPWCPKTFNSNSNMHAHRKKIHPKEWEEAKLQKYSGTIKLAEISDQLELIL